MLALDYWAPVPGHARYEVSCTGVVRNRATGLVLKPWAHRSGHLYVALGRGVRFQLHHIVIAAFGPMRPAGTECRHLDGNATRNRASNLAWGTRKENVDDLKRTSGRYARSTVSDDTAVAIRRAFTGRHGEQTQLAIRFGLKLSVVNRLVRGKTYAPRA